MMAAIRGPYVSLAMLALALIAKQPLTDTMARHMLVHIPLIMLAGWFMGPASALVVLGQEHQERRPARRGYGYNAHGIPGLLLVLLVTAWWMLPRSLDDVLISPAFDALKFFSSFLAGVVLRDSLRRANRVVILFFVGNFCWMTAIVGLLYQENITRLCNFYLLGDQELAGRGLVILAIVLPLFWLFLERDKVRHYLRH